MKYIILSMLFSLSMNAHARLISASSTLQLYSPDRHTKFNNVSAYLTVTCKYRAGVLYPELKLCGTSTIEIDIENDGLVTIPEIRTFNTLHGLDSDNYEVSLAIKDGTQRLATLSAKGYESIISLSLNKQPLNILRINEGKIPVTIEGNDFFESDSAKDSNGILLISLRAKEWNSTPKGVSVTSSIDGYLQSYENKNSYDGKILLKDLKEITIPPTSYAYFGEVSDFHLKAALFYYTQAKGIKDTKLKASAKVNLNGKSIEDIGVLELK